MSSIKKLILAYILLVMLPMSAIMMIVSYSNEPIMAEVRAGFEGVANDMSVSTYQPIYETMGTSAAEQPEVLKTRTYYEGLLKDHSSITKLQVKIDGQLVHQVERPVYPEVSQVKKTSLFRAGENLIEVTVSYIPKVFNLTEGDIHSVLDTRIKLGILSYLLLHLLFIIFIFKYYVKPIQLLKRVAEKVTHKQYDFDLDIKRPDEIGDTFRAFDTMRESIQRYEENRRELVANISHDLKTPITAMRGYVTALQDGVADSPEKTNKYLSIMGRNINHLDQLVDDLFFYAKLDVDQVAFDMQLVNLNRYMEYLIDDIRFELEPTGVQVFWSESSSIGTYCEIDAFKFRRVITNLVNNAVKHFDKPEKELHFKLTCEGNQAIISVQDNGKGIAPEDIDHIFNRFYRADSSRNTYGGGSGLGLAISKQILDKHSGSLSAQSVLNEFTVIEIRLPMKGAPDEESTDY